MDMEAASVIGPKLAPFNPTNAEAIDLALDLLMLQIPIDNFGLGTSSSDGHTTAAISAGKPILVYDLGCGDARFLIQVWHSELRLHSKSTASTCVYAHV
jgi:hypothetical protein